MTALIFIAIGLCLVAVSAMLTFDSIAEHHARRGEFRDTFARRREGRGGRDTSND